MQHYSAGYMQAWSIIILNWCSFQLFMYFYWLSACYQYSFSLFSNIEELISTSLQSTIWPTSTTLDLVLCGLSDVWRSVVSLPTLPSHPSTRSSTLDPTGAWLLTVWTPHLILWSAVWRLMRRGECHLTWWDIMSG